MKFKKGDRVVVVSYKEAANESGEYNYTKIGDLGIFSGYGTDGDAYALFDCYPNSILDIYLEDIEHEAVYNSPLYKALT